MSPSESDLCAVGATCGPKQLVDACGVRRLALCSSCGSPIGVAEGVLCTSLVEWADGGRTEVTTRLATIGYRARGVGAELDLSGLSDAGVPQLFSVGEAPDGPLLLTAASGSQLASWSSAVRLGDSLALDIESTLDAGSPFLRSAVVRCAGKAAIESWEGATCAHVGCGARSVLGRDGRYHGVNCGECDASSCLASRVPACGITCVIKTSATTVQRFESVVLTFNGVDFSAAVGGGTIHVAGPDAGTATFAFAVDPRAGGSGSGTAVFDAPDVIRVASELRTSLRSGSLIYSSVSISCMGSARVVFGR